MVIFFTKLYTIDDLVEPDLIIDNLQARVNDDMNISLYKDFSNEEISDALFQIGPLKAPRPNGFPARFFPNKLGSDKDDVTKGVNHFCL